MEYVITVVMVTKSHPNGEFVFRTSFNNQYETSITYDLLVKYLPYCYKVYVDRYERVRTDITYKYRR